MLKNLLAVLAIAALFNGAQAQSAPTCSVSLPRSLIVVIELTLPPQYTDGSADCCTVSDKPPKRASEPPLNSDAGCDGA